MIKTKKLQPFGCDFFSFRVFCMEYTPQRTYRSSALNGLFDTTYTNHGKNMCQAEDDDGDADET